METRTTILLVLVSLTCYGCMFYYMADVDQKPQFTASNRHYPNTNSTHAHFNISSTRTHFNISSTRTHFNISSTRTHFNISSTRTHFNISSTRTHFNISSTRTHFNISSTRTHFNASHLKHNSTFAQLNSSHAHHNITLVKKILFWTSWFGDKNWAHILKDTQTVDSCNVNCSLSANKANPLDYDLLVFHGRDPQNAPKTRRPHQVYLMLLQESPVHREEAYIRGDHFYNWSATYSHKSDFLLPYLSYHKIQPGKGTTQPTVNVTSNMLYKRSRREAVVSWIVSNCHTSSRREEYVKELQKHITVDIFGACGKKCLNGPEQLHGVSCHHYLARKGRKFYLSFENSACRDYITEKVMWPLEAGMVPVVYGGLGVEDYLITLPPGSFINTRNFTSPKQLAEYLTYLDRNNTAYLAYHAWRGRYEVGGWPNTWCQVCQALHNTSIIPQKNINWDKFWNPTTDCDTNLLSKIGGPKLPTVRTRSKKAKG